MSAAPSLNARRNTRGRFAIYGRSCWRFERGADVACRPARLPVAQCFYICELFRRYEAAGDSAFGLVDKFVPIFLGGRAIFLPRRVVTLFAGPDDVAAVDVD